MTPMEMGGMGSLSSVGTYLEYNSSKGRIVIIVIIMVFISLIKIHI